MTRINCQGREYRENFRLKELMEIGPLLLVQVNVIQQVNALFGQQGTQHLGVVLMLLGHDRAQVFSNFNQLLLGRSPVGGPLGHARFYLLFEGRHAHHEKFIQVGAEDRRELQPLQQGVAIVHRLVQHSPVELNPTQFPVEVVLRIVQVDRLRFRSIGIFRGSSLRPSHYSLPPGP